MRLIIVSNRLPVTAVEKRGSFELRPSAGGLATGLQTYINNRAERGKFNFIWIGWPGIRLPKKDESAMRARLFERCRGIPVYLSQSKMDKFYNGFCNKTIWALFHYFPSYAVYDSEHWRGYEEVNELFCQTVLKELKPGDTVWIHDYHLMLLPGMLRKKQPDVKIGFFLHIPFPSFELFRLLPSHWRVQLLQGLLGADLIGFHTHDYAQYFLKCVNRILGCEQNMSHVALEQRVVKVDTFPMGIDFNLFNTFDVSAEKQRLAGPLHEMKVILSIDRLDYTKGIANRLRGYAEFLERNPKWHGKIVLVLAVVPSRIGVEHYQQMKRQIDELVGQINGRYGSIRWNPIHYQYKSFSRESLVALYRLSDVALITPIRDGMNLIAKEYVAARKDKTGVLILSEMAGTAKELGEAVIINPNTSEIASALAASLEMPREEQIRRMAVMQQRIRQYNVEHWVDDFLGTLGDVKQEQKKFQFKFLTPVLRKSLAADFAASRRRLLLLDYDGTLVPFADDPGKAKPDQRLLAALSRLAGMPDTEVAIVSGRGRKILDRWLGGRGLILVAEHGVWMRRKDRDWVMPKALSNDWKSSILPILKAYARRLPGASVEEKEFSVVWHFRRANSELAEIRAKELVDDLAGFTANSDIQALRGNKVVEIRNASVNKGTIGAHFLERHSPDFILAAGDDWTDEDLFKALPQSAYSIKVGMSSSYARFNLNGPEEVGKLICGLANGAPKNR